MPSQGISNLLKGFQSLSMGFKPSKGFPKGFQTFSKDFKQCKARRWPSTIPVASFVLPVRDSTSSAFDFVLTQSCQNWRYLSFVISVFKLLTSVVSFCFLSHVSVSIRLLFPFRFQVVDVQVRDHFLFTRLIYFRFVVLFLCVCSCLFPDFFLILYVLPLFLIFVLCFRV